ncbi:uncharacterized protein PG986_013933 [Apiospora aurea]|uniref:Uncharacterized protein n=1 Tax=Apiospora aurea TaxID=335848 RepID=A0ABR1PX06_9PEZI
MATQKTDPIKPQHLGLLPLNRAVHQLPVPLSRGGSRAVPAFAIVAVGVVCVLEPRLEDADAAELDHDLPGHPALGAGFAVHEREGAVVREAVRGAQVCLERGYVVSLDDVVERAVWVV